MVLTDWFARKNVDDTVYLFIYLFGAKKADRFTVVIEFGLMVNT